MTTFFGLFQGDYDDNESEAVLLAVFSTEKLAGEFEQLLSDEHTNLKKLANVAKRQRERGDMSSELIDVPNLYWDIRPVPFDPRDEEDL